MSVSILSISRFRYFFTGWWCAWSAVHTAVLTGFDLPFAQALADSLISNLLMALSCLLIINNMRYYLPRQERYGYLLGISVALSLVWLGLTRFVLWLVFRYQAGFMEMLNLSSGIRFAISFLMTACMSVLSLLWYTVREQKEQDERKADTEKTARDAELFKLRQQLQPHFLFNSLNSINALIGIAPEEARSMVHKLSSFLRGTLKKEEQQWISLDSELEYLQLYLDIEKVRFGNRLTTSIHCPEEARLLKLPALLLQPILENAIKFGLYDTTGAANISLEARKSGNELIVTVQNPFDPETASPRKGTGFGLNSVQRRLYLLFDRRDLLHTSFKENIFITSVNIPQHE